MHDRSKIFAPRPYNKHEEGPAKWLAYVVRSVATLCGVTEYDLLNGTSRELFDDAHFTADGLLKPGPAPDLGPAGLTDEAGKISAEWHGLEVGDIVRFADGINVERDMAVVEIMPHRKTTNAGWLVGVEELTSVMNPIGTRIRTRSENLRKTGRKRITWIRGENDPIPPAQSSFELRAKNDIEELHKRLRGALDRLDTLEDLAKSGLDDLGTLRRWGEEQDKRLATLETATLQAVADLDQKLTFYDKQKDAHAERIADVELKLSGHRDRLLIVEEWQDGATEKLVGIDARAKADHEAIYRLEKAVLDEGGLLQWRGELSGVFRAINERLAKIENRLSGIDVAFEGNLQSHLEMRADIDEAKRLAREFAERLTKNIDEVRDDVRLANVNLADRIQKAEITVDQRDRAMRQRVEKIETSHSRNDQDDYAEDIENLQLAQNAVADQVNWLARRFEKWRKKQKGK